MARIVVVGSFPESLVHFRRHLLSAMVAQGHDVHACSPPASQEVVAELDRIGVRHHAIHLNRTGTNVLDDIKTVRDLFRVQKQLAPDVFLGYTLKPVIYGSLAARFARTPHIFSLVEGLGYAFSGEEWKRRAIAAGLRALFRIALGFNERVFVLNPDDLALFLHRGLIARGERATLLGGIGVDLEHFKVQPLPRDVSFLMTARLLWDKGVRHYVEAARILRHRYPKVRFRLAGGADDHPACVSPAQVQAWVAEGVIEYLGHVKDVRPVLADTSVFVLPSYREGVPVTVMEAMAMGRPIITTDAPGCRETVDHGRNGLLVRVRDSDSLADAMERFITEPKLIPQFGKESRRMAEERFNVHEVNTRLLAGMGLRREAGANPARNRVARSA